MTAIPSDLQPLDRAEPARRAAAKPPLGAGDRIPARGHRASRVAATAPFVLQPRPRRERRRLAHLRDPRHRRRGHAALHGRFQSKLLSFHTSIVFLLRRGAAPAAGARRPDRRSSRHARVAEGALHLVHPELQHLQLHAERRSGAWAAHHVILQRGRPRSRTTTSRVAARRARRLPRVRVLEPLPARRRCCGSAAASPFRETQLFSFESLSTDLVLDDARRRARDLLDVEPVADPGRARRRSSSSTAR